MIDTMKSFRATNHIDTELKSVRRKLSLLNVI